MLEKLEKLRTEYEEQLYKVNNTNEYVNTLPGAYCNFIGVLNYLMRLIRAQNAPAGEGDAAHDLEFRVTETVNIPPETLIEYMRGRGCEAREVSGHIHFTDPTLRNVYLPLGARYPYSAQSLIILLAGLDGRPAVELARDIAGAA